MCANDKRIALYPVLTNGKKILNANDCILETPERVKDIQNVTSNVDILFINFRLFKIWVGKTLLGPANVDKQAHIQSS